MAKKISSKTMLALLAATAALAGGAQALVPAPAAAMVNQGEECDPNFPSSDCEPDNGGGGDSSGGGGQGADGGPIVGEETIEVSGKLPPLRPSPCTQFSCLAHQLGGGPQVAQADRGPRLPRHGGRPVRVAQDDAPAARCRKANLLADAAEKRMRWFEEAQRPLVVKWRALDYDAYAVEKKVAGLRETRDFLRGDPRVQEPDLLLAGIEAELAELEHDLDNLKAARNEVASNWAFAQYALLRRAWAQALGAAAAACAKLRGAPGG